MTTNPDPIVERYLIPVRPLPARPTEFAIRHNNRGLAFTIEGQFLPYYVSIDGGNGFLREAEDLATARTLLVRHAVAMLGEVVRGGQMALASLCRLCEHGEAGLKGFRDRPPMPPE